MIISLPTPMVFMHFIVRL